jgi:hypothetical protein
MSEIIFVEKRNRWMSNPVEYIIAKETKSKIKVEARLGSVKAEVLLKEDFEARFEEK